MEDAVAGATSAVAAGIATFDNLQFVAPAERAERRAALEQAGVSTLVTSWSGAARLLGVEAPVTPEDQAA